MRSEDLNETNRQPRTLSPGPRHMRKRRFHREIPDHLLSGVRVAARQDAPQRSQAAERATTGTKQNEAAPTIRSGAPVERPTRKASPRAKRLVALSVVVAVSAALPSLIIALFLLS